MKTTISTIANKVIVDTKKLTSSPIERKMIEELLKFGRVDTAMQKGFSTDDRTSKIFQICQDLGLKVYKGNSAPKGGKIGNFVERNADDTLLKQTRMLFKRLQAIKKARQNRIEKEASEIRQNQRIELVEYFENNPDFRTKIKNRIENFSSKQWRNWVRMKVCQVLNNEKFETFKLGATDIREAVYYVK